MTGWLKPTRFTSGFGKLLPEAYRKFWAEWKEKQPTAVHYIPKEGNYELDKDGQVRRTNNVPIPIRLTPEAHQQIWGGEGIVMGFQKRQPMKRRVPHFWIPTLRRTVLRSDVLNEFMSVIVTDRTMALIHESYGFDHYILKTPACDLKQLLPLRLKRRMLQELQAGCPKLENDPSKREFVLKEYSKYLAAYTPEEIEWYGFSFTEALKKLQEELEEKAKPVPYKLIFREKLIEQLKTAGIEEALEPKEPPTPTELLKKLNPFAKKEL